MTSRHDLVIYASTLVILLGLLAATMSLAAGATPPAHAAATDGDDDGPASRDDDPFGDPAEQRAEAPAAAATTASSAAPAAAAASPTLVAPAPAPPPELAAEADTDAPIDGGLFHLDAFASDTAEVNLALQFGGDGPFLFLGGGVDLTSPGGLDASRFQVGAGFGLRIPIERFFVDLDAAGYALLDSDGSVLEAGLATTRLGLGYRFATHFAVYAGASANFFFDADLAQLATDELPEQYRDQIPDTTVAHPSFVETRWQTELGGPLRLAISPGFYLGFEL